MRLSTITHKSFADWGASVPRWSRWWIDDERFKALALLLEYDARPYIYGEDIPPAAFAVTWKGIVTIYRKSDYDSTRRP